MFECVLKTFLGALRWMQVKSKESANLVSQLPLSMGALDYFFNELTASTIYILSHAYNDAHISYL